MKNVFLLFITLSFFSCSDEKAKHDTVNSFFQLDILTLIRDVDELQLLVNSNSSTTKIQSQFLQAHRSYKRVELLTEYYFPAVAKALNGPALPEFEQNDGKTLPPEGFQVIEELVFPNYDLNAKPDLLQELGILSSNLKRLKKIALTNQLTDAHIFDAMRLEVFRILTLGITGFDSPIAKASLAEASISLETVECYYSVYDSGNENPIFKDAMKLMVNGKAYLKRNPIFDTFDRAHFIINYLNPISKKLFQTQQFLKIPFFDEDRPLRVSAQTLFDKDAFDEEAFSAFPDYKTTTTKIQLGQALFNDPVLSGDQSRSCASCHYPDKAFTDGLVKANTLDGKSLVKRNTPTLLNIAFQSAFFYDSKVNYLEDQAVAVIQNKNEMHGSLDKAVIALKKDLKYMKLFKTAFPKSEINEFAIKNALASYIRSLSNYNARFDDYMRGNSSFTTDEIAGFNLFSGKAKCATCHFIPLTNGTAPPVFDKSESEVLGVPNTKGVLDEDLGKYEYTKAKIHRNSFKTPTLRNITLTGPYMHNGVYQSLDEVVDFYNKGGGSGLGFNLDNQTLPTDSLNLSPKEKQQIIQFMKTLTDY